MGEKNIVGSQQFPTLLAKTLDLAAVMVEQAKEHAVANTKPDATVLANLTFAWRRVRKVTKGLTGFLSSQSKVTIDILPTGPSQPYSQPNAEVNGVIGDLCQLSVHWDDDEHDFVSSLIPTVAEGLNTVLDWLTPGGKTEEQPTSQPPAAPSGQNGPPTTPAPGKPPAAAKK